MVIRDEKSELLEIINSIPANNVEDFGYGVLIGEIYKAFNGPSEIADVFLFQLEKDEKIEIFRKPELDDMILAVRII